MEPHADALPFSGRLPPAKRLRYFYDSMEDAQTLKTHKNTHHLKRYDDFYLFYLSIAAAFCVASIRLAGGNSKMSLAQSDRVVHSKLSAFSRRRDVGWGLIKANWAVAYIYSYVSIWGLKEMRLCAMWWRNAESRECRVECVISTYIWVQSAMSQVRR